MQASVLRDMVTLMQGKNNKKQKGRPGRPRTSNLTAQEQTRLRKRRQRAKLARQAVSKVEVWLPMPLKAAIKRVSGAKSLSEIGAEAFRAWLAAEIRRKPESHSTKSAE